MMLNKVADLAGPGIGDYAEVEKILPAEYRSILTPRQTQQTIFAAKNYIEDHLCKALNLMMVTVPLIVDAESGVGSASTASPCGDSWRSPGSSTSSGIPIIRAS